MEESSKKYYYIILGLVVVILASVAASFAIYSVNVNKQGTFNIEVTSQGVDTLVYNKSKPANIQIKFSNFDQNRGHDVSGNTTMEVNLSTTKKESDEYCYSLSITLPDEKVFDYSVEGKPELVLSVAKLVNNKYENIIDNKDITTSTGKIEIPTAKDGKEFINKIKAVKGKPTIDKYQATLTFKYFKDVDQKINELKTYSLTFEANTVECK